MTYKVLNKTSDKLSLKLWNFPLGLPIIVRAMGNFKKLPLNHKPVILLLHNLLPETSGAKWYPFQLQMGKSGIPSLAPDFPGFGLSKNTSCSILEKGTPLMRNLLEFLDLKNIIIIGEGIGAALAMEVAKNASKDINVNNVLLLNPTAIRLTSIKELNEVDTGIHIFVDKNAPLEQVRYAERIAIGNQKSIHWINENAGDSPLHDYGQLANEPAFIETLKEMLLTPDVTR